DFARADVIAALGAMTALPDGVSLGQWDRLSRQAGVVRGESQWRDRLGWLAAEKREAAAGLEHADGAEARLGYARRQLADAERMVESFVRLAARLRPPPEAGWGALADWASRLHADLLPAGSGWPPLEHEAGQLVD